VVMLIDTLVTDLSYNPFDPALNFAIAQEYEAIGQTASAVSFYLRTAEYGFDEIGYKRELVYASLIKAALCFEDQKNREKTVHSLILKAIDYYPTRPEAYFHLSRIYEKRQEWQEAYTFASVGLSMKEGNPLPCDLKFDRNYLWFEKAVAAWWLGRKDQSILLFEDLLKTDIDDVYRASIKQNLLNISLS